MNEMRKLMETVRPFFESSQESITAAVAFLDREVEKVPDEDEGLLELFIDIWNDAQNGDIADSVDIIRIRHDIFNQTGDSAFADYIAGSLNEILDVEERKIKKFAPYEEEPLDQTKIKAALKFLDGEIQSAVEYETNDDDMGWDDDDDFADDSEVASVLREIRERVAAGMIATEEDIQEIEREVYDASMGSSEHYGDTDLAMHIAHTLRDTLGIDEEELDEDSSLPNMPQQPQRQDALNDQLRDLIDVATKLGMYDAADYLKSILD